MSNTRNRQPNHDSEDQQPKLRASASKEAIESGRSEDAVQIKPPTAEIEKDSPVKARVTAGNSVSRARRGTARQSGMTPQKLLVVLALAAFAFFASYSFAASKTAASAAGVSPGGGVLTTAFNGGAGTGAGGGGCCGSGGAAAPGSTTTAVGAAAGSASSASVGGGCCGGGGAPVEGKTTIADGVQKIDVDTAAGTFNPNVIKAKAGVPIEINFTQSGGGCLSGAYFPDFNINQDLTAGPQTVKLPALAKGEYSFYCQMQMVSAKLVVE